MNKSLMKKNNNQRVERMVIAKSETKR